MMRPAETESAPVLASELRAALEAPPVAEAMVRSGISGAGGAGGAPLPPLPSLAARVGSLPSELQLSIAALVGGDHAPSATATCWLTYETRPRDGMFCDAAQGGKWFKDEACARFFAERAAAQPRSSQPPPPRCCCGLLIAQFSYEGTQVNNRGQTVPKTVCCWGLCYKDWCCSGQATRQMAFGF